jgi:hypothetical protein
MGRNSIEVEHMLTINTENKSQQTNFLPPSQELLAKVSPAGSETAESAGANEGENKKPVASVGKAIAHTVSPKKLAANKKNSESSTGPRTAAVECGNRPLARPEPLLQVPVAAVCTFEFKSRKICCCGKSHLHRRSVC